VVIIGYDEVGRLIELMLERANIPHVAVERDLAIVQQARRAGRRVYFGDLYSPTTQEAAGLGRATAVFVTSHNSQDAKALAVTLHRLYAQLHIYVRVRTLGDQDELIAKGIKHAGTGYIESTLTWGGVLLKDLGISEDDVSQMVGALREDNYAPVRAAYAQFEGSRNGTRD
jgi:Trk K+ transport system NAD-binding subunit